MALQIRRGPTADRMTKKFAQGELIFDTDINEVFIGDSVDGITGTNGGRPVTSFTSDQARDAAAAIFDNPDHENITFSYDPETKKITASVPDDVAGIFNVADDLTPELGGNLNLNNKTIDGTGTINITGTVTSTGDIQTTVGSLRGTHIGVVRSGDGSTIVVNNGTDGTDAVFIGTLNGNASTVTNGVVTTGSYSNPSWITSLAGTKVTDAVLSTGSYSDPTWITSLDGSKVNGAVLTSNSYADPSWITSLSSSKITGDIVATNGVVTTESYADPSWITSLSSSKITGTFSSDSIIEGSKLFFTQDLARGSVSNGTGILYDLPTGVFSLAQDVAPGSNVSFGSVSVAGAVTATSIKGISQIVSTSDGTITGTLNEITIYSDIISKGIITSSTELSVVSDLLSSDFKFLCTTESAEFGVPLTLVRLTTVNRDALPVENLIDGTIIFNTTDQKFQGYVNDVGLATSGVANSTPGWVNFTVTAA